MGESPGIGGTSGLIPTWPDPEVAPLVDAECFSRLVELGGADFLREVLRLFTMESAECVEQAEHAVALADRTGLIAALTSLRGMAINVGAGALGWWADGARRLLWTEGRAVEQVGTRGLAELRSASVDRLWTMAQGLASEP